MRRIINTMDNHPYITVLLSGLVMSLCFVFKYLFLLAWVGAVPFMYVMLTGKRSVARSFVTVLLFGLGFYGLQYTWFLSLHSLEYMGITEGQSMVVVVVIWLAVTLAQSLQMSVAGALYGVIKPKGVWSPAVLSLLMMCVEWAQGFGDFAMVWGKLALTQYAFLPNLQTISLLGSLSLGFVILMVNGLSALALSRWKDGGIARAAAVGALALFVGNMFVGTAILAVKDNTPAQSTVRVASIQCNFPSDEKWGTPDAEIWEELMTHTQSAAGQGAKVIIWPESALKQDMELGGQYYTALTAFARNNDVYLFVGGFTTDITEDGDELDYNSFVGFSPDENETFGVYNKRQLVPFGEFVPISGLLERFETLSKLNLKSVMEQGKKTVVFKTPHADFSPLICFDSIFPRYSRQAVRKGADILLVGTNDSWFLGSEAVYQHNGHAVLRAVENNKWLVRSANAGQSSIIANDGKVIDSLVPATSGLVIHDVGVTGSASLYSVVGDVPFLLLAAGSIICAFVKFRLGRDWKDIARIWKSGKDKDEQNA